MECNLLNHIVLIFFLVPFYGCNKDSSSEKDKVEYTITQDAQNDYIVYLKNDSKSNTFVWDYFWGITHKQVDTVIIPLPGKYDVAISKAVKEGASLFTEKIEVTKKDPNSFTEPELKLLTNFIEGKKWVWETSTDCWGKGEYLTAQGPNILGFNKSELEEKRLSNDAIVFDLNGMQNLTRNSEAFPSEGKVMGSFTIDMKDKIEGWSIGKLVTNGVTVMGGYDDDNEPFYEYHIIKLTENELHLCAARPGTNSGGEAWFWKLKVKKWDLVWEDDFEGIDGNKPNNLKWDMPEYNRRPNPNGPDGHWSKEDVYLENNELVIRIRELANGDFSTGAVRTKGKQHWANGKFEIKCKLPQQQGWWVAFWMMTGDVGKIGNGSSDGAELDIMEAWGWTDKINHAIHWDGYGSEHKVIGHKHEVEGIREGYHIYTLEWHSDVYIFFVDNKEVWRTTADGVCNETGYLKITGECSTEDWAIGNNWSLDPRDAIYPDYFRVDWVKVYQLSTLK